MAVATSIAATCTISASSMTFGPYTGAEISATSDITVDCTNGSTYSISLSENANSTPQYWLYKGGTVSANATNQLGVIFTHAQGTMVGATVALTGTGIGSSTIVGAITGTIAGSQAGKAAGNFTRTMTLNLAY